MQAGSQDFSAFLLRCSVAAEAKFVYFMDDAPFCPEPVAMPAAH